MDKSTLRQAKEFDRNKPYTKCSRCGREYNLKNAWCGTPRSDDVCIYCGKSYKQYKI